LRLLQVKTKNDTPKFLWNYCPRHLPHNLEESEGFIFNYNQSHQ